MFTGGSYKEVTFLHATRCSLKDDEWHDIFCSIMNGDSVEICLVDATHDGVPGPDRFHVRYFAASHESMLACVLNEVGVEHEMYKEYPTLSLSALMTSKEVMETLDAGFSIYIISNKDIGQGVLGLCTIVRTIVDNS